MEIDTHYEINLDKMYKIIDDYIRNTKVKYLSNMAVAIDTSYTSPFILNEIHQQLISILSDKESKFIVDGKSVKVLGEGASGVVSKWCNVNNCYAVKKVDKEFNTRVIGEYFVGTIINNMRFYCPNFLGTYAYLEYPTLKKNYIFYELVENSIVFEDFILYKKPTEKEVEQVLAQVFLSLQKALELYKFNHNDLHINNILIKKYNEPQQLLYTIGNYTYVVESKYVPIIIDYGRTTIEYNGRRFCGEEGIRYSPVVCVDMIILADTLVNFTSGENYKIIKKMYAYFKPLKNLLQKYYAITPLDALELFSNKKLKSWHKVNAFLTTKYNNIQCNISQDEISLITQQKYIELLQNNKAIKLKQIPPEEIKLLDKLLNPSNLPVPKSKLIPASNIKDNVPKLLSTHIEWLNFIKQCDIVVELLSFINTVVDNADLSKYYSSKQIILYNETKNHVLRFNMLYEALITDSYFKFEENLQNVIAIFGKDNIDYINTTIATVN